VCERESVIEEFHVWSRWLKLDETIRFLKMILNIKITLVQNQQLVSLLKEQSFLGKRNLLSDLPRKRRICVLQK
jgi:hypothetical protein